MIKRIIFSVITVLAAVSVILYADEIKGNSGPELVFNTGHSSDVYTVDFSRNGKFLASGGGDGAVKIWDAATGRELRIAGSHQGYVSRVKFSPDSRFLASCGRDKKIQIWKTEDWRLLEVLDSHDAWVKSLSFSPDSRMLASSGEEPEIIIWNTENWRKVKTINEQVEKVDDVCFSPDGKFMASGFYNKSAYKRTVLIRDTATWSVVKTINRPNTEKLCFSPDSKTLVANGEIYNLSSGEKTGTIFNSTSTVFSPDGKSIIASKAFDGVFINNPVTGLSTAQISLNKTYAWDIAIHPGGTLLAVALSGGTIAYVDINKKKELKRLSDNDAGLQAFYARIYYKSDGTLVARKDGGGNLTLWNMISGIRINTYRVPEKGALCTFSEKGKLFAYAGADGKVVLIDTGTGKEARSYPGVISTLQTIELNRDGTRLLLAQWKTVKLVDTSTWKEIISINTANNMLAKLSPDGRFIASASGSPDYNITIFNTADGKIKNVLKGHSNRIHTLDFSPDGKRLISGSGEDHKDNSLRVWDLESGNQISTLAKKGGFIYSAAFSPDGKKIAAVSTFRKVMLFDASGGSTITEFEVKGANLTKISFSVDGRRLLIGSSEGVIRIYDIETDAVIAASAFTKGNEYVLASTDGRYDATKGGVDKLHWVSGNEVIMLGDFDKGFHKKGLLPLLAGYNAKIEEKAPDSVDVSKQLIGKIAAVSGKEITVNSSRTLAIGDKIFLLTGGKRVTIEVTFPMLTVAKCRVINSADSSKIKKGMPVFR